MTMISRVLLDTCFLIEMVKDGAECQKNALDYFNYFNENNIDYFLSPIVVSEYWHNDLVDDFSMANFKHLTYNFIDGRNTAAIAKVLKEKKGIQAKGNGKYDIKDDYKLMAHLLVDNKIDCFITKDKDMLKKYVEPIKELFPELKNVTFIDINLPISATLKPQTEINFPK